MGFLGQLATGFMQGRLMTQERERQRRADVEDLATSRLRRSLLEREETRQERTDAQQRAMNMLTLQGPAAFSDPAFQQAMGLTPEQARALGAKARVREEAELHGGITNFLRSPGAVKMYEEAFGKKFPVVQGELLGTLQAPDLFRREDLRGGRPSMQPMIPRPQPGDMDIRGGLEALRPQGGQPVGAPYPVRGPERVVLPPTPSEMALALKEREAAITRRYKIPTPSEYEGGLLGRLDPTRRDEILLNKLQMGAGIKPSATAEKAQEGAESRAREAQEGANLRAREARKDEWMRFIILQKERAVTAKDRRNFAVWEATLRAKSLRGDKLLPEDLTPPPLSSEGGKIEKDLTPKQKQFLDLFQKAMKGQK